MSFRKFRYISINATGSMQIHIKTEIEEEKDCSMVKCTMYGNTVQLLKIF